MNNEDNMDKKVNLSLPNPTIVKFEDAMYLVLTLA